jgi:HSP20 family protein
MAKAEQKREENTNTANAMATTATTLPIRRGAETALGINKTSPFTLMRHLAEDMENMLADFGPGRSFGSPLLRNEFYSPTFSWFDDPFFAESSDILSPWSPAVEVFQRENQLVVRADLPGLKKDDVKIEVTDNALTIQGERKQESEENREGFYRSERSYGSFYRAIPLPEGAKTENAKATFNNGVLEVSLEAPKLANVARRLEISGS